MSVQGEAGHTISARVQIFLDIYLFISLPQAGMVTPFQHKCKTETTSVACRSKLRERHYHKKLRDINSSKMRNVSVVILIRTDTTLDHSQKAEKVCDAGIFVHIGVDKWRSGTGRMRLYPSTLDYTLFWARALQKNCKKIPRE